MKKLAAFICILVACLSSRADHLAGVDLTYVCTGNPNEYIFTVTMYRDCAGIPITQFTQLIYQSACSDTTFIEAVPPVSWDGVEITPFCPDEPTICQGGSWPGFEMYQFVDTVVFPEECDDWLIGWTDCCRSINVTNIDDAGLADVFIDLHIDNTNGNCNNSPVFANEPIFYACNEQTFCYNAGATDPDGDSLSYELVEPLQFLNVPVVWLAGFDSVNFLTSDPPVSLNPATGDLCVTPDLIEVSVLALKVIEWRDGEPIGSVTRDIQISVFDCDNVMPSLLGFNGDPATVANSDTAIQWGTSFSLSIEGVDDDLGDQEVTLFWDAAIDSMTWDVGDPTEPIADIYWEPDSSDVSDVPYCFTVQIQDNACPYFGSFFWTYCITVIDTIQDTVVPPPPPPPPPPPTFDSLIVQLSATEIICTDTCNGIITVAVSGGAPPLSWTWSDPAITDTTDQFNICGGHYALSVTDSLGTTASDSVTLIGPKNFQIQFLDSIVQQPLPFTAMLRAGMNTDPTILVWRLNQEVIDSAAYVYYTFTDCGEYHFEHTAFNAFGCSDTAAFSVSIATVDGPVVIPNVFSPNGDGYNDYFQPAAAGVSNYQLQIFSRWGELIFESNRAADGWAGRTFSGLEAPAGVYFYKVSGTGACDAPFEGPISGTVHLLR